MSVSEFIPQYKHFLDKSTIIYGETGTGKSFIVGDIMHSLKSQIDQVIVFSPTDNMNHTYDRGLVPKAFIHYKIEPHTLDVMWERQEALSAVYTRANNKETIMSLYRRINDAEYKMVVSTVRNKLSKHIQQISMAADKDAVKEKIDEVKHTCDEFLKTAYKECIKKHMGELGRQQLSEDERFALQYLNINPRLLLIFDDCTDLLSRLKTNKIIQKLFYQGRHCYVTIIIACHTDKALASEIRAQSFINIFTEDKTFRAYFKRTDCDRESKKEAEKVCSAVFTPLKKHQKLVITRRDGKYHKYTAAEHPGFKFCSNIVQNYSSRLEAKGNSMPKNNRFLRGFM